MYIVIPVEDINLKTFFYIKLRKWIIHILKNEQINFTNKTKVKKNTFKFNYYNCRQKLLPVLSLLNWIFQLHPPTRRQPPFRDTAENMSLFFSRFDFFFFFSFLSSCLLGFIVSFSFLFLFFFSSCSFFYRFFSFFFFLSFASFLFILPFLFSLTFSLFFSNLVCFFLVLSFPLHFFVSTFFFLLSFFLSLFQICILFFDF